MYQHLDWYIMYHGNMIITITVSVEDTRYNVYWSEWLTVDIVSGMHIIVAENGGGSVGQEY